ncbi:MAG: NAD(P)H-dependent oxidoreductase [Spirochaetales bacterium]|jgi:NAD(P)H dehydrogenase (quinone)|nr:NAD(P)H-dependent oxidoreductase [Spirochaetales bacterium]
MNNEEFVILFPMNALVVLCHPDRTSFNYQIAKIICETVVKADGKITFHDLYSASIDPVLSESELKRRYSFDEKIQEYMKEVQAADVLFFVHPDWWGQMPALLKGWIDRVFRPGIAYDYLGEEFLPKQLVPLLKGRRGLAICTTDAEDDGTPHPLKSIWEQNIFKFCGIEGRARLLYSVWNASAADRKEWLLSISAQTLGLF